MSGGHFEYKQYQIEYIADEIQSLIDNNGSDEKDAWGYNAHAEYSEATITEFKNAVHFLKLARMYAHRIDWLVSGDDGEDSFHRRLQQETQQYYDSVEKAL